MLWYLLPVIMVPIIELYLLIAAGRVLGIGGILILLLATAFLGAWLLKRQGLLAWQRIQIALAEGVMPGNEMVEAVLILVGGLFLLFPGFLTDLLGLLLLLPWPRVWFRELCKKWLKKKIDSGNGGSIRFYHP